MLVFSDFKFDPSQRVLYKNDEVVTLTANQSKLLGMFLDNPSQVYSKDDILSYVWKDRVVSEQVVFQNISQLRSIFTDKAIKTFPKRGYQWQLPLQAPTEKPIVEQDSATHTNIQNKKPISSKIGSLPKAGFILLVLFALIWQLIPEQPETDAPNQNTSRASSLPGELLYIPFSTRYQGSLQGELSSLNKGLTEQVSPLAQITTLSADDFFNSPYMTRKQVVHNGESLMISGYLFDQHFAPEEQRYLLEYVIQGPFRHWHGYIQAATPEMLSSILLAKIDMLTSSQYFTLEAEAFTTSELSLMQGQYPEDLDIFKHLIERLLLEDTYQAASAQIEQMAQQAELQQHTLYQAYALWLRGQLLYKLNQYEMAETNLLQAKEKMTEAQFLALQSEINKTLAELASVGKEFKPIQDYLYQSASQARLANRPVQEIRAYTLLSIKASKLGLDDEKYNYLIKAKTLLADYQLDDSHYMLPFYHFALFAETEAERQRFYLKVLEQPVTPKNYWVYFSVSEQLSRLYGKQGKWTDALALAENITEPARGNFLKAKIYQQKGDTNQAVSHALISFDAARTRRIDWVGLDMALLLLDLGGETLDDANKLMYKRYIREHATRGWINRHQPRLNKVGITMDPYQNDSDSL